MHSKAYVAQLEKAYHLLCTGLTCLLGLQSRQLEKMTLLLLPKHTSRAFLKSCTGLAWVANANQHQMEIAS
eukprot:1149644-Pelagomonas_calceolata.AAC.3